MGKSWHGGKGCDSRVADHKAYRDSPLWKKDKGLFINDELGYIDPVENNKQDLYMGVKKRKCLFLDDQRVPENAYLWDDHKTLYEGSGIKYGNWAIVRSYDQFVEYIQANGIPDVVSFDNDLFDVTDYSVSREELTRQLMMDKWEEFPIKTGAHCAQHLVNQCLTQSVPIPEYYVHSANNNARPIIRKIMDDAIQCEI